MADDDKKEDALYRVDTVPPPPGESDAYNAPTKVGPITAGAIQDMMQAAERNVAEHNEQARKKAAAKATAGAAESPSAQESMPTQRPPPGAADGEEPDDVPKVYDEVEDDDAATMLNPRARPPQSPVSTSDLVDGVVAKGAGEAPLAPPNVAVLGTQRSSQDALLIALFVALATGAVLWLVFGR